VALRILSGVHSGRFALAGANVDAGIWRELIESMFADSTGKSLVRTLAEHVDPGFMLVNAQGICLYANGAMQEMTGFSTDELSIQRLLNLPHPYDANHPLSSKDGSPLLKKSINRQPSAADEELLFHRKDGSSFHATCSIQPVQQGGQVLCFAVEVRDSALIRQIALKNLETEVTYQLAADVARIGTWDRDLSTDLVRQSARTSQILGLGNEQTILHVEELSRLILPEDLPYFGEALQAAIERNEPFDLEFRIRRKDGAVRWIATRGMGIRNAKGRPVRVSGVMFDITEKKRVEETLRATEISYQLATEAANIGTWELDFSDGVVTVSPISATMLGLPPDKKTLLSNEWRGMIFSEDLAVVMEAQKAAVNIGEPFRLVFRLYRTDGKLIWITLRGIVKKNSKGIPVKAIGVMIDATDKREAEESLRQEKQRLSLILECCSEGVYGIGADYRCTFMNRAAVAMLEFDESEPVGQIMHERLFLQNVDGSFYRPEHAKLLQALQQGATLRVEEEFLLCKDEHYMPISYSVSPMLIDGKLCGAVIIFTDITERKQAEAREKEIAAEALVAAEANAKFRTFFEQGSHFSGVMALDGTLIESNRLSLEQCGFTREETIGKKFWECGWWNRSPEIMERVREACLEAADGKLWRQEIMYFWADGSEHVSDLTLAPVTDANGKVLFVAPTGTDITDKIRYAEQLRRSEERFRSLTEFSPEAILVEQDGKFVYANEASARLLGGKTIEDLIGRSSFDFIDAEFRGLAKEHRALNTDEKRKNPVIDLSLRRLDGQIIFTQAACGEVVWEETPALQILLRDVTELKVTQDKLRLTSERLQLAIEGSGEGIWDWDIPNNRFTFSGGLDKILGRAKDATRGEAIEWKNAVHPDDYERVLATFRDALEEKKPLYECEYRLRTRNGNWKWIWARGVIVDRDEQGRPLLMTGTLSDITARKESDELAWRHANLDVLTGLPSRRLFRERLEIELLKAKRSGYQLAVLFIDLDGFKQVNDSYGHDAGDLLLMDAARRLKSCVRETDSVARLGGDEFTVILSELANLDHVELMCQEILSSLAEPFHLEKDIGYISGSIGVSLYPFDAATPDDLLRKADQAMYAAKHTGKNQFNYFTKEMDDRAHTRLHIINELRHALQEGQLEVHYQPVVELITGKIVKAEALLRWHHPTLGNVEPAEFIPMAEESGLIKPIGNWVFKQAVVCCKQCKDSAGEHFQISVNKSPIQFMAREAETNWLHFLSDQDMPANSISVEITEGVLLHASAKVEDRLMEFRDAGVEVALDDFGTGYSSMSYLQKFHIDYVKIDQSFIRNVTSDANSRTIAETIIMMAHKLGQKVIAEGIETPEQLEYLIKAGCDYGQGFLFAYPVPAENLVDMVSRQASSQRHLM
jgi:diguanylate cyclase (GGDEF)-like protein/PAS domain S-box-containing protein